MPCPAPHAVLHVLDSSCQTLSGHRAQIANARTFGALGGIEKEIASSDAQRGRMPLRTLN
jgi:hypothetical protein